MEDELPVKKRMKFEDPLQGDALNREEATDVLPFSPQFVTTGDIIDLDVTAKIVCHRISEYMVYVGILGTSGKSVTFIVPTDVATKINTESLSCSTIDMSFTDKEFPDNVSTDYTTTMSFTITTTAKDEATKDYDAYFCFTRGVLKIVFTGDIFELGKGDHTLRKIKFSGFGQLVFLPTANTITNFKSTLGLGVN